MDLRSILLVLRMNPSDRAYLALYLAEAFELLVGLFELQLESLHRLVDLFAVQSSLKQHQALVGGRNVAPQLGLFTT